MSTEELVGYRDTVKQFGPIAMGYNNDSTLISVGLDVDRVDLIDVDEALDMIVFLSTFVKDAKDTIIENSRY